MSAVIRELLSDQLKPWLNIRVNSVKVDGNLQANTITGDLLQPLTTGTSFDQIVMSVVTNDIDPVDLIFSKLGGGSFQIQLENQRFTVPEGLIIITPGSDTAPTQNFAFIELQAGIPVVVSNTTNFPTTPHVKLATVFAQSEGSIEAVGPYSFHKFTDELQDDTSGHITHINNWIRNQNATYRSGMLQTFVPIPTVTDTTLLFSISSGLALQLHEHVVPAIIPGDYFGVNDPDVAFKNVSDLIFFAKDSNGVSLVNKFYNIVLWVTVNVDPNDSKFFINLPSGSYLNELDATTDVDAHTDFCIPIEFRDVGLLLSRWTIQNIAGTSWKSIEVEDLRGHFPNTTAGGGGGGGGGGVVEFSDNNFRVFNVNDNTKKLAFDVVGVASGSTSTLVVPNVDGEITIQGQTHIAPSLTNVGSLTVSTTGGNNDIIINSSGANSEISLLAGGVEKVRVIGAGMTVDIINELTVDNGVDIETVHFEDGGIQAILPDGVQVHIDGATNPRTTLVPLQVDLDANVDTLSAVAINVTGSATQNDIRGVTVLHDIAGATTTSQTSGIAYEFNIVSTLNHHVDMLHISKTGVKEPSMTIHAVHIGPQINPIFQESGALSNIEQAWTFTGVFTDVTLAFNSDSTNVGIFVNDNDVVYVGKASTFCTVDFDLSTTASVTISPVFEYWNGAWTAIATTDNTIGMQNSGTISFIIPGDWVSNIVNSVDKFYFRVTRTRNNVPTTPIEKRVRYLTAVEYIWDSNGDVDINNLTCQTNITIGGVLVNQVGNYEIDFNATCPQGDCIAFQSNTGNTILEIQPTGVGNAVLDLRKGEDTSIVDLNFHSGVTRKVRMRCKATDNNFQLMNGGNTVALTMIQADGKLQLNSTYAASVSATVRPVFIDSSGNIGGLNGGTAIPSESLKTTGNDVVVSAAAQPSIGQVLTATSSSNATWQAATGPAPITFFTTMSVASLALAGDPSFTSITGCSIDLTSIGTYIVGFTAKSKVSSGSRFVKWKIRNITDSSDVLDTVGSGLNIGSNATDIQTTTSGTAFITIAGNTTIHLQGGSGGDGAGTHDALSDGQGFTTFWAHKL